MKTENKVLMSEAREILKGNWGEGVKVTLIYLLIVIALRALPKVGSLISLLISGPFLLGITIFWLSFTRKQEYKLTQIFEGFNSWWPGFKAYFLVFIYTFLWTLLLIVPGIIAVYSYSLTFYILADDRTINVNDAIDKSKEIMKGNKWKLFFLQCRFLGWGLLCILTLGIGFLWLIPYAQVTMARFYDDVKDKVAKIPEVSEVPVAM